MQQPERKMKKIDKQRDNYYLALEEIADYGGHLTGEDAGEMKSIAVSALRKHKEG